MATTRGTSGRLTATVRTKTAPQAKATTTTDVTIKPDVRRKLMTELRAYADLSQNFKPIKHAMDTHKAKIRELRESTGSAIIEIDGFKIRDVTSTMIKFNPAKFVAAGGSLAMYEDACETKPKKPYEKITMPGEKEYGDD